MRFYAYSVLVWWMCQTFKTITTSTDVVSFLIIWRPILCLLLSTQSKLNQKLLRSWLLVENSDVHGVVAPRVHVNFHFIGIIYLSCRNRKHVCLIFSVFSLCLKGYHDRNWKMNLDFLMHQLAKSIWLDCYFVKPQNRAFSWNGIFADLLGTTGWHYRIKVGHKVKTSLPGFFCPDLMASN